MSVTLSGEFVRFIATRVESGSYPSADDVLREAFALLEEKERLLQHVDEGIAQLQSGEFTDYSLAGLQSLFDQISKEGRERLAKNQNA
jgi:putative addiction module CopG family antidote